MTILQQTNLLNFFPRASVQTLQISFTISSVVTVFIAYYLSLRINCFLTVLIVTKNTLIVKGAFGKNYLVIHN